MKIIDEDYVNSISKIIVEQAKYQKVMLLYDENVTLNEIDEIYNAIKENCIFNKQLMSECLDEIYNGYRVVIYISRTDSFLRLNIDRTEFINIYIPLDNAILPFYLDGNGKVMTQSDYLLIHKNSVDLPSLSSIYFNKFLKYMSDIIYAHAAEPLRDTETDILCSSALQLANNLESGFQIYDIPMLKECNIEYRMLPLIDYLLITGIMLLIRSARTHSTMLVDVYKSARDDERLINKFYAMNENNFFLELVNLNYNSLNFACESYREKLKNLLFTDKVDISKLESVTSKIKNYLKNTDGILGYLYLYDIFGV